MNKIINGVANDFEFDGIETFNRWQDPTINDLQQQLDKYKNVIDKIKEKINEELKEGRPIEEGKPEEYLWLMGYYDAYKDLNELLEEVE